MSLNNNRTVEILDSFFNNGSWPVKGHGENHKEMQPKCHGFNFPNDPRVWPFTPLIVVLMMKVSSFLVGIRARVKQQINAMARLPDAMSRTSISACRSVFSSPTFTSRKSLDPM